MHMEDVNTAKSTRKMRMGSRATLGITINNVQSFSILAIDISDLDDVQESVKEIVDWIDLGLKLGIHYYTLMKIEEESRRVERCKREMLAAWLQGEDDAKEQTWSTLVDALEKMDCIATSQQIRMKHNYYNTVKRVETLL